MAGRAWLLVASSILGPGPVRAHDVIQAAQLEAAIAEIARLQTQARDAVSAEALYALGERVEQVVDLVNLDAAEHGAADPFARLVVARLRSWGLGVEFSEVERRYVYDLEAFRGYLARAPDGARAAAAWYRLLARSFYRRLGPDPSSPAPMDAPATARAAEEEKRFLERHPADERAREVHLFLAVDWCRLASAERPPERNHRKRCRSALQLVRSRYPGTMEARSAETLLEGGAAAR